VCLLFMTSRCTIIINWPNYLLQNVSKHLKVACSHNNLLLSTSIFQEKFFSHTRKNFDNEITKLDKKWCFVEEELDAKRVLFLIFFQKFAFSRDQREVYSFQFWILSFVSLTGLLKYKNFHLQFHGILFSTGFGFKLDLSLVKKNIGEIRLNLTFHS
jgi:hypothetical protein